MLAQLRYVDRLPQSANHIPNQPLVASHILARNHRSLRNSTMPNQRRLNLPRLNPEAAQLHLTIRTPAKLQNPVQTPARQVPAPVHPAPSNPKRVRYKPLRRQSPTPQIATPQTRPRYRKLHNYPSRYRRQNTIQPVNPQAGNATTDQTASTSSDNASVEQHITA